MTRQILLSPAIPSVDRRQLLQENQDYSSSKGGGRKVSFAEVAGGTVAECGAVCCCCPCGLANLVVLAVYKVPAGLCRKALRRKRHRRMIKNGLLPPRKCGYDDKELQILTMSGPVAMVNALESDKDVAELEKEMWEKFYGAGFWRSPSQRSEM